jgi:hypothetical protein
MALTSAKRQTRCRDTKLLKQVRNHKNFFVFAGKYILTLFKADKRRKISPKTKQTKSLKQTTKVQPPNTFIYPVETLVIKQEIVSETIIHELKFCRCCFVSMSEIDEQFAVADFATAFEDIIQLPLESSSVASSFCVECFQKIQSYSGFKSLAISKQHRFKEILVSGNGNFSEIFGMVCEELKEKPEEQNVIREDIKTEEYEMYEGGKS